MGLRSRGKASVGSVPELVIPILATGFGIYHLPTVRTLAFQAKAVGIYGASGIFLLCAIIVVRLLCQVIAGKKDLSFQGFWADPVTGARRWGVFAATVLFIALMLVLGYAVLLFSVRAVDGAAGERIRTLIRRDIIVGLVYSAFERMISIKGGQAIRVPRTLYETLTPWAGKRMIFIHTPKCGGSFVASAFGRRFKRCPTLRWPEAAGHLTYRQYKRVFAERGENLDDYTLFTVLRNPWDWHVSWYHYVSRDIGGRRSGMPVEHEQIKDLSFSDYVHWLEDEAAPRSRNDYLRRQLSDWIIDDGGHIANLDILRQENLHADLVGLRDRYGLRLRIPSGDARINASRKDQDYRRFYSDEDAARIARRHARDIDLFGYRFE